MRENALRVVTKGLAREFLVRFDVALSRFHPGKCLAISIVRI